MKVRAISLILAFAAAGALAQSQPMRPSEYFKAFLQFKFGAEASRMFPFPIETFDDRNGYCEEVQDHGGDRYTFAVWNSASGKLFGFTERSPLNIYGTAASFWTYDRGHWTERKDVVPPIGLEDFWEEQTAVPVAMKARVTPNWSLPRVGTTINVSLIAICPSGDGCEAVDGVIRSAKYQSLDLVWHGETGKFSKGRKKTR